MRVGERWRFGEIWEGLERAEEGWRGLKRVEEGRRGQERAEDGRRAEVEKRSSSVIN